MRSFIGRVVASRRAAEAVWIIAGLAGAACVAVVLAGPPAPTTLNDFYLDGTQPNTVIDPLSGAHDNCVYCHQVPKDEEHGPYDRWTHSMMGQAARDPVFHACLAIANQDAAFAGELCLRCHAPVGWLNGRSEPPDGSALGNPDPKKGYLFNPEDLEGVSCIVCHRMVDPNYVEGTSPPEDEAILEALPFQDRPASLTGVPYNLEPHAAKYVIDPMDNRRGPRNLSEAWPDGFYFHYWIKSPFHNTSRLCATCHDVSNPVYSRQADGTYALNTLDQAHPSQRKGDMFPIERTYSEWANSLFQQGPVDVAGRFGGALTGVSSCQDCHMPTGEGKFCRVDEAPVRPDVRSHNFNGANTWVLRAVNELYDPYVTDLTNEGIDASIGRAQDMLARASDVELTTAGSVLNVRVVNMTGHKLPTGYGEGRRMWINVKFFDEKQTLLAEHGVYDPATATLVEGDTKVYETRHGISDDVAKLVNRPAGVGFHFALNNKIFFDNRIPPMGFTNASFAAAQAEPVGYDYADGQYWDDTLFTIPENARSVTVSLFHQVTSREYIEFLRDENTTNNAGQLAYDLWSQFGKSEPTLMDEQTMALDTGPQCPTDWNHDGIVNSTDVSDFINSWFEDQVNGTIITDFNHDGVSNSTDVSDYINSWFENQPYCH
jgi:hypothetical protein